MSGRFGVIGVPWDWSNGNCHPGARFGPESVRGSLKALLGFIEEGKVYSIDEGKILNADQKDFVDYGDVDVAIYDVQKTFDTITEKAENILKRGDYLCAIGGDHSISFPLIRAIHNTCQEDIAILQFDGHLDLLNENAKKGRYSHSSPFRRSLELPRVKKLVQVGVRSYNTPDFDEYLKRQPITQFTSLQVHQEGAEAIAEKVYDELNGFNRVYVTICIDGFDPGFAPGCSMSEAFGLLPHHVLTIIKKVFPISCGFDICEVTPIADVHGMTAAIAARLIFDCFVVQQNK